MSNITDENVTREPSRDDNTTVIKRRNLLQRFTKRFTDIVLSFLSLLILSPVFLFIAVRNKRDSPGPCFYRGERMGRYGKPFGILKFRTMYECPESYNGSPLTSEGDPRVTPFGKWLRRTKSMNSPTVERAQRRDEPGGSASGTS
jgi:lipopolysaccharide/colanic/teichoic acid biosynthesis glycosyltransferase